MTKTREQHRELEIAWIKETLGVVMDVLNRDTQEDPCGPTIESVYGKPIEKLNPPQGYAWAMKEGKPEFRIVARGDWWLCPDPRQGNLAMRASEPWVPSLNALLILRKCKRLVFDIVIENGIARNESLASNGRCVHTAYSGERYRYILSDPRVEE